MPELPDAELFRRIADAHAAGRTVTHTHVPIERLLSGTSRQRLSASLKDARIDRTARHGKMVGLGLSSGPWVLFRFGMTGYFRGRGPQDPQPDHTAVELEFSDGAALCYVNVRRFGEVSLAASFDEAVDAAGMGPDALDIDREVFEEAIAGHGGLIKPLLMNQDVIAGVGNIYADEILFHALVRPDRRADTVTEGDRGSIHREMRRVLHAAIDRGAYPRKMPKSWLLPRREVGEACPRCDGPLERKTISGRNTLFCPACQS